jgi:hypothetical protein
MFFNRKFYYNCLTNFIMKRHPVRIPKGLYISKSKLKCRCKITQTSFDTMPQSEMFMVQRKYLYPKKIFPNGLSLTEIKRDCEIKDRQKSK